MKNIVLPAAVTLLTISSAFLVGCDRNRSGGAIAGSESFSMIRKTIHHDGTEREYFVHVPWGTDREPKASPVVVALHGYGSTATGFQAAYDLNSHADKHSYIVVYPQGSHFQVEVEDGNAYRTSSWNDLAANQLPRSEGPHCLDDRYQYPCPPECGECGVCGWTSCYDDVGFIGKMLDEVQAEFSADPQRTYILGVSNGAMMALRLGCNLSERIAAVVPIIAQLAPGHACGPESDTPMLHLYGGADNSVRSDGRPGSDGFIYTTARDTARVWADALRCAEDPTPWETEYSLEIGLECNAYTDCAVEGHEVVSCTDVDLGHEWPGQRVKSVSASCIAPQQFDSMPGQDHCPSATGESQHLGMDLAWEFMSRYRNDLVESDH